MTDSALQSSYDRLAPTYATRLFGELADKPLDRALLDRFADLTRDAGPVGDLGCGPGHVARYLRDRGVDVFGVDLSAGMVEQARQRNPDIAFHQGDLRRLAAPNGAWAGIAAFYVIIHVPHAEVVAALRELWRVLKPGGWLLLAWHVGDQTVHPDDLWGTPIDIDFIFYPVDFVETALRAAGFAIVDTIEREPYPDIEAQTRRAYLFAQKPNQPHPKG